MTDTSKIDSLLVRINRMIDDHHKQIENNQMPDFIELEGYMRQFDEQLLQLSGEGARKYTEILKIWIDSIRQMTATLERYKNEVEEKLNDYQNHSGAINAYTNLEE